jgi:hypothetical protein
MPPDIGNIAFPKVLREPMRDNNLYPNFESWPQLIVV